MRTLEAFLKFIIGSCALVILTITGILITQLLTYIVRDIAFLYKVKFIMDFTFLQLFGTVWIIGLLFSRFHLTQKKENKKFSEQLSNGFSLQLSIVISFLLSWWFAYIAYSFLT